MRQLEERLGLRLLHRTTRSVSVTDAGLRPVIEQIAGAIENSNEERQRPLGRLRIYAASFCGGGGRGAYLGALLVDVSEYILSSRWARRRSTSWRRDSTLGLVRRTALQQI
jgi:hypothetical protein